MKVCLSGASGRMGGEVVKALSLSPYSKKLKIVSGLVAKDSANLGEDLGEIHNINSINVKATSDLEKAIKACDVVIDFSSPVNAVNVAKACAKFGKMLVTGTTGLNDKQVSELQKYAKVTKILWSMNMSFSVNLMTNILGTVTKALGDDFDIEVLDAHHSKKVDAPSGTAIMMGNAIASVKGWNPKKAFVLDRHATHEPRKKGQIGFASIRAGGIIGEHKVTFASDSEIIDISSKILNRNVWAVGAIKATLWLNDQKPGHLHSMKEVLGL